MLLFQDAALISAAENLVSRSVVAVAVAAAMHKMTQALDDDWAEKKFSIFHHEQCFCSHCADLVFWVARTVRASTVY